ncbi:MAG: pilus assembly protein PilM, partial [Candidatus Nanopelagicales bacterium]|nr:pilus assembly protein PilM [Candidatus Nanopelagicales bacterium]
GSSAVRLAVVSRSRSGPVLENIAQAGLAPGAVVDGEVIDPDSLRSSVRQVVKSAKPRRRQVRLGVMGQRMVARQVDLPWVPPKEFKKALPLLAADLLPMPVDDCVLDFMAYEDVVDEDGSHMVRGLLVAAEEEGILRLVDAVEGAGLQVVSVTLTPLASLGAVADPLAPGPEAVVDVGYSMTSVTIHEKGQPRFVRILGRGGRETTQALAEDLGISEADAEQWKCALPTMWSTMSPTDQAATENAVRSALSELVTEIRTSVGFYSTSEGSRLTKAYLVGGAASMLGLAPILASVLHVPVDVAGPHGVRPAKSLSPEGFVAAASPACVPAVSLGLEAS